jgi:hypothetical protein
MAKFIFVFIFQLLIWVTIISQIIIPLFTKLEFFWLFRKKIHKEEIEEPKPIRSELQDLEELEKEVAQKTEEYASVIHKVEEAEEKIGNIKQKTEVKKSTRTKKNQTKNDKL